MSVRHPFGGDPAPATAYSTGIGQPSDVVIPSSRFDLARALPSDRDQRAWERSSYDRTVQVARPELLAPPKWARIDTAHRSTAAGIDPARRGRHLTLYVSANKNSGEPVHRYSDQPGHDTGDAKFASEYDGGRSLMRNLVRTRGIALMAKPTLAAPGIAIIAGRSVRGGPAERRHLPVQPARGAIIAPVAFDLPGRLQAIGAAQAPAERRLGHLVGGKR